MEEAAKKMGNMLVCLRKWGLSWAAAVLVGSSQKGGCRVSSRHVWKRPLCCAKEFALCSQEMFFKMRVVTHWSTMKSM